MFTTRMARLMTRSDGRRIVLYGAACLALLPLFNTGCSDMGGSAGAPPMVAQAFQQVNLTTNRALVGGAGAVIDPNLVNPWGIAFSPGHPVWISDNGTGVSTLYDGTGAILPAGNPLVVTIPGPGGSGTGAPSGIVSNTTPDFALTGPGAGSASFIFATLGGTLDAWNGSVGKTAAQVVNNSAMNALYKGLAEASNGGANFLYATDFHNARVDVFNGTFQQQARSSFPFTDPAIPAGFAPFGIQNLNGVLYVTYAKQDNPANAHADLAGPGNGFVDVYRPDGTLMNRFASGGVLNSPWGMTIAPSSFGPAAGALLVGNFGDGRINAFNLSTGALLGTLSDSTGRPIVIDGLWGLAPGTAVNSDPNAVYFTAGPNHEADGIFGKIVTAATRSRRD